MAVSQAWVVGAKSGKVQSCSIDNFPHLPLGRLLHSQDLDSFWPSSWSASLLCCLVPFVPPNLRSELVGHGVARPFNSNLSEHLVSSTRVRMCFCAQTSINGLLRHGFALVIFHFPNIDQATLPCVAGRCPWPRPTTSSTRSHPMCPRRTSEAAMYCLVKN